MKVLVTGANGHLGFNVCKAFVEAGHEVRASIRSADDRAKADPLRAIGVTDIVGLNIRAIDPFVDACRGIDVLLHVAATYAMRPDGPAAVSALIADSVEGAENAIRAAAAAGVPKVVLTSSVATLPRVPRDAPATTEADWASDLAVPYFRAKVEGERAAWKVAEETGVTLMAILPGTIGGPGFLRPTPSIDIIENIMNGSLRFGAPNANVPYIDVRDVAAAHVLAATRDVTGRFIVVNDHVPTLREVSMLMHDIDPTVRGGADPVSRCGAGSWPGARLGAIQAVRWRAHGHPRDRRDDAGQGHQGEHGARQGGTRLAAVHPDRPQPRRDDGRHSGAAPTAPGPAAPAPPYRLEALGPNSRKF